MSSAVVGYNDDLVILPRSTIAKRSRNFLAETEAAGIKASFVSSLEDFHKQTAE
jgi:hypothetical protein